MGHTQNLKSACVLGLSYLAAFGTILLEKPELAD